MMRFAPVAAVLGACVAFWLGAAACSSFSGDDENPGDGDGAVEGAIAEASGDGGGVSDGGGDSACVDVTSDPANCGRCGHGCQGGACADASCQSFRILGGGPNVVSIAVSDAGIYFIDDVGAQVLRCPATGCTGAASPVGGPLVDAREIIAVTDQLVVRAANATYHVTPAGGSTEIGSGYSSTLSLATDGKRYAYYTAVQTSTKIWRFDPKGDAGAETVIDQNGSYAVATNGDRIFFLVDENNNEVMRSCLAADCRNSASNLVISGRPLLDTTTRLAATKDALFWTRPSTVETCSVTGCQNSTNIHGVPEPDAIAVDENYVYFTARANGANGTIERCSHMGCADRITLATGFKPRALVVTAGAIYWATENNGQTPSGIWRLAK